MPASEGRREASKRATRTALLAAAKQLFAEQGYSGTTVRDIAAAARVTERTFYRYFDGKEDLIASEYLAWLDLLRAAIASRPGAETPPVALQHALLELGRQVAAGDGPIPLWLFSEGPPATSLRRSGVRPLLQLEAVIAGSVLARMQPDGRELAEDETFDAWVISRAAVAALRSAVIWQRERPPGRGRPSARDLLLRAFAAMSTAWPLPGD